MNDIRNEYFTKRIAEQKLIIGDKIIYKILPKYGKGHFTIYKIIKGMYLFTSDLEINKTLVNKFPSEFSSPVIKIDYCIEGAYTSICPNDKICKVEKGSSVYYAGTKNFIQGDFEGRRYRSISVFCYLNDIINSVEKFLAVSSQKLKEYYKNLFNEKNYLIVKTDLEILRIINDISKYLTTNNDELTKIRVLELFFKEIANYDMYKSKKKKYYKRSTIDKVKLIKRYIEDNMQEHCTIKELSKRFNLGTTELKDCFKQVNGMGPYAYLKSCRMHKASEYLVNYDYSVLEIATMFGYSSQSKFSASFKKEFGVAPSKYRKAKHNIS